MAEVLEILKRYQSEYDIHAVGVGCFGPIDINTKSTR